MDEAVIEISGLVKTFGTTRALDGLDLTVARGEVHGFLGPERRRASPRRSGSCSACSRKDAGEVRLFGGDPWREAAALHRRLAYVPGDVSLWPNLTGGEVIDLLGRLRGGLDEERRDASCSSGSSSTRPRRAAPTPRATGRRSRWSPRCASDVELLVLDEPTSGLDPLMEAVFQEYVERVPRRAAAPCCCRATSSPRSSGCATG